MVKAADGGTAIIDRKQGDRIVATCPQLDEALAIMAFLNGDLENGQEMHAAFLRRLDLLQ
jgi:hypothetical protein